MAFSIEGVVAHLANFILNCHFNRGPFIACTTVNFSNYVLAVAPVPIAQQQRKDGQDEFVAEVDSRRPVREVGVVSISDAERNKALDILASQLDQLPVSFDVSSLSSTGNYLIIINHNQI